MKPLFSEVKMLSREYTLKSGICRCKACKKEYLKDTRAARRKNKIALKKGAIQ